MEILDSATEYQSPVELVHGRAVKAIGIGLCESTVVLSLDQQIRLNEDLETLAMQARGGIKLSDPSELVI